MDDLTEKIEQIKRDYDKRVDIEASSCVNDHNSKQFLDYSQFAYRILVGDAHYRRMIILTDTEMPSKLDELIYVPLENYTAQPDPDKVWGYAPKFVIYPLDSDNIIHFNVIDFNSFKKFMKSKWFIKLSNYIDYIITEAQISGKKYVFTMISAPSKIDQETHYLPLMIDLEELILITFDASKNLYIGSDPINLSIHLYSNLRRIKFVAFVPFGSGWQSDFNDIWCQTWALYVQINILDELLKIGKNLKEIVFKYSKTKMKDRKKDLFNFIVRTVISYPEIKNILREQYKHIVKKYTENDEKGYREVYKELMEYVPNGTPSEIIEDYKGIYEDLFPFEVTHRCREFLLSRDPVSGLLMDSLVKNDISFGKRVKRRSRRKKHSRHKRKIK